MHTIAISSLVILSNQTQAGGFEGTKAAEINFDKWECEYCPKIKPWEGVVDVNLGALDDTPYRFGNYSGYDNDFQMYLNGDIKMQQKNGPYWQITFQNIGLDSAGLQTSYGKQGLYKFQFDYQGIPVRKYDHLQTPFSQPGSSNLGLNTGWLQSGDGRNFTNNSYSNFALGTDWDLYKLKFNFQGAHHLDYNTSYRRLEKQGVMEFSATQILNATYLPYPVDETTEDYSISVSYVMDKLYAAVSANFSKFSNNINSVNYANPFVPLSIDAAQSSLAASPDNSETDVRFMANYAYARNSFAKISYAVGTQKQNQAFLPYTTNPNLSSPLPQNDLDGKVDTQDLAVKLQHWINAQFTMRAKYHYHERNNKTQQLDFSPVVNDLFTASTVSNLPYDYKTESTEVAVDYHPAMDHLLNVGYINTQKTRNFQSIHKTTDDGYYAKYRGMVGDKLTFMIKGEQLSRDSSAPDLIDYLNVTENPLMRRFNVADRDQDKVNFQLMYSPWQIFNFTLSGLYSVQKYIHSQIGLTHNLQQNVNLDFNLNLSDNMNLSVYAEKEKIKTELAGSSNFSIVDWNADNQDKIDSYGLNFSVRKLLSEDLKMTLGLSQSNADTLISLNQTSGLSSLPSVASLWSNAQFNLDYQYTKQLNFGLRYEYQKFESQDYAIDNVDPGSLTHLLSFGELSNNYSVNYLVASVGYSF